MLSVSARHLPHRCCVVVVVVVVVVAVVVSHSFILSLGAGPSAGSLAEKFKKFEKFETFCSEVKPFGTGRLVTAVPGPRSAATSDARTTKAGKSINLSGSGLVRT